MTLSTRGVQAGTTSSMANKLTYSVYIVTFYQEVAVAFIAVSREGILLAISKRFLQIGMQNLRGIGAVCNGIQALRHFFGD
jgi:hypothetical protein